MSYLKLKKNIDKILEEQLVPLGFKKVRPLRYTRELEDIIQGINFFKHRSLNADIYLHYKTPFSIDESINNVERISYEYFATDEQVQNTTEAFQRCMSSLILPYFKKYQTVYDLIESDNDLQLFGPDIGWRLCNKGWALIKAGESNKGKEYLYEVINKYSDEPIDFIQNRKKIALEYLQKI